MCMFMPILLLHSVHEVPMEGKIGLLGTEFTDGC